MKTVAIIQARASSTRLPGKVMMALGGKPMLQNIVERIGRAETIDEVVVATSVMKSDDVVAELLKKEGIPCFRGSLDNVLERFFLCAKQHEADIVIRFTGDNALVSPELIDEAVKVFQDSDIDYLYYKKSLPLGMCIEVFSFSALRKAYEEAKDSECLEHVTPYIRKNPEMFRVVNYENKSDEDHSGLRFTLDTPQDYEFVSRIYDFFGSNTFSFADVLKALEIHPDWIAINSSIVQKTTKYKGEA